MSELTMLGIPHPAVVYGAVSEGAVLLHTETEVYYGLNRVGARIWELLTECADEEELCEALRLEFPDAPPELRNDVRELLEDLMSQGLLLPPGTDP